MKLQAYNIRLLVCAVLFGALLACSGEKESRQAEEEGVFDPLVESVDKAKLVEKEMEKRVNDLNKAIDDAQNGSEEDEDNN